MGERPQLGKPPQRRQLFAQLTTRMDGLTSAIIVFPLFLFYQIGILTGRGHNGVDYITGKLIDLANQDIGNYLYILGAMVAVYCAVMVILRQTQSFRAQAFAPALIESLFYALIMGSLIVFVINQFMRLAPPLAIAIANPVDILVISAGAGFHEELIFRLILMSGLGWLLAGITGKRRAWVFALALSSIAFSFAHHLGAAGEPFTFAAFTYRSLAGVYFGLIYHFRGFAVAAWTHAIYDVYVLSLGT